MMAARRTKRSRDRMPDRGITVLFFAISLTGILGVAGLVLGGSVGYTAARNAQTAADAAALAGASALQEHKTNWVSDAGGVSAEQFVAEIESVVEDNGAELVACDLVKPRYAITLAETEVLPACDELAELSQEDFEDAVGVRVRVRDERGVPFSAFVGSDTITGGAEAAATAQPVGQMRTPFLVCGTLGVGEPPLELDSTKTPPKWEVNVDAVGEQYVLWGNPVADDGRSCGHDPDSWRGLADAEFEGAVGGWWKTSTGNKTGQLSRRTNGVGTCDLSGANLTNAPELMGCIIPVPLCVEASGQSASLELRCVAIAAFEITHVKGSTSSESTVCDPGGSTNVVCGKLLDTTIASHGRGVADRPDDQVAVIKLVE